MINYFITGATGFVGQNITSKLITEKKIVYALVRDLGKAKKNRRLEGAELIYCDISNNFYDILFDDNSFLIHCAWEDVQDISSKNHLEIHYTNQLNFLKHCFANGLKNLLVVGTCYEYGKKNGPVTVKSTLEPNNPYAIAKVNLNIQLNKLKKMHDFNLIWCRLFYCFGEGQHEKSIFKQLDKALEKNMTHFNMSLGEQLQDYLPIELVAEQIYSLLSYPEGVYNVCSGQPISLRELVEKYIIKNNKKIKLNLGFYDYRDEESLAIWGDDPITKYQNLEYFSFIGKENK